MYSVPVISRQVAASLPVVLTERLAWVPVTTWPLRVSLTPTFKEAVAAAAALAPLRLGPLGRVPPLREVPAEPALLFSSRTFWANSRVERSGLLRRTTEAEPRLESVLADLPRLLKASRRANTRARLGLCWALTFLVLLRLAVALLPLPRLALLRPLARALERDNEGVLLWAAGATVSWHLHLCSALAAGAGAAAGDLATSVRVRSRDVSARLPRLLRASRRARPNSRLGFGTGLAALRCTPWLGAAMERLAWGRLTGRLISAAATEATSGAFVREGLASLAERTRLGAWE